MRIMGIFILLVFLTTFSQARPSWCASAKQKVEKRICANTELSRLDDRITEIYRNVKKNVSGSKKQQLVKAQRKWIKKRNQKCKYTDDSCIKQYYVSRIDDLQSNNTSQPGVVHSLDPNGDGFLSIRDNPKGNEIGKLYNGNKVKILSKKGKYYKVKVVSSGKIGYAHSNWIRKTKSNNLTSTSGKKGVVYGLDPNGDGFLSIRKKPKGKKIGNLYNGDSVTIVKKKGKWYKIKTASSGQVGWVHGDWVNTVSRNNDEAENTKITKKEAIANIKKRCFNYMQLPTKYKNDKEIIDIYLQSCDLWSMLKELNSELMNDKDFIYKLIDYSPTDVKYIILQVANDLKKDKQFIVSLLKLLINKNEKYYMKDIIQNMDPILKKDKSFLFVLLDIIKKDTFYIKNIVKYFDLNLFKDKHLVSTLVEMDGYAFEYAHEDLKENKDFVLLMVKKSPKVLCRINESLRKNYDIVMAAVLQDGDTITCADKSFRKNKEIVFAAVEENADVFKYYVDESLLKDKELLFLVNAARDETSEYNKAKYLCERGSATSCYNLGVMYHTGKHRKQNYNRAEILYSKACDKGNAQACSNLGLLYADNKIGNNDYIKAIKFYDRACDGGEGNGCYNLGHFYLKGKGEHIQQDYSKAAKYYEKACAVGHADGCFNSGILYANGRGVEKDYHKAKNFYLKACNGKKAMGCVNLGALYYKGGKTQQDTSIAKDYFKKACELREETGCKNYEILNKEENSSKRDMAQ